MRLLRLFVLLPLCFSMQAEEPVWKAFWIAAPDTPPQDYGVYHFRRTIDLAAKPDHFRVRVSGDNRYQLYVNGTVVSSGPARGDLTHWRFESVDLAPSLQMGKNVLAAVVWNDGAERGIAQISNRTGFVLEADDAANARVNTGRSWVSVRDRAYTPRPLPQDQQTGYYALGPNEQVDAALYPWGWEQPDFDDSSWAPAQEITRAAARDARDAPNRWMLVRSEIPLEERREDRPFVTRTGTLPMTVPPNTRQDVLLDLTSLTTGYPETKVSGGRGTNLTLRYAESLYVSTKPINKGNRNDVDGKTFVGPSDSYMLDGKERVFRPLFWRTYRYVRVEIKTADEPVTIQSVRSIFTGYPFERRATFDSEGQNGLKKILDTGWHTARLCAHESYMDCPFYEQLQYGGDARIQMLVSLFETGDARLMKNGIALLDSSRTAEGATYSRAPSNLQQYIPGFSLWWIGMVHDYFRYVNDPGFVRDMLPGMRAVLSFYARHQKPNGSLKKLPWWNFVDWAAPWPNGEPPADPDGSSPAASDLQLLLAFDWAADLEDALGNKALAAEDLAAAKQLRETIRKTDWDDSKGLFADQPSHRTWSQQVNTLAVLAHVTTGEEARSVVEKTLADKSLTQSSIYFRAYTNATLREAGLGDRYVDQLGPWRQMLDEGLTTLAEWNGPDTRSDCHAWGASPNFEVLRTIAGIDSGAPGFGRVLIRPNLGGLQHVKTSIPHPNGTVAVDLTQNGSSLRAVIDLPTDIPGDLVWHGKEHKLQPGHNELTAR
jgi:hypothetical protein